MNPKQKMYHQRLVTYLKQNGLKEKDAINAANKTVQTLIRQGDGFKISNVNKMGKWLINERAGYDNAQRAEEKGETVFDATIGKFFNRN